MIKILLNLKVRKDIQDKKAYVAGWGLLKNYDCFTNDFGPVRHGKCRQYYKHKRKTLGGCTKSYSPSMENKRCKQFKRVRIFSFRK